MDSKMTPSIAFIEELELHLESLVIEDLKNNDNIRESQEGAHYYVEAETDFDFNLQGGS
jgi:hypothetical protein